MMELPETMVVTAQINKILIGKKITHVFNATKLHRFAFFHKDPKEYEKILAGKIIKSATGYGMFIDITLNDGAIISVGEGANMKYGQPGDKIPGSYQLLIGFEDNSFLVFSISLYGFIGVYADGVIEEIYHKQNKENLSPLQEAFSMEYFNTLIAQCSPNLSVKALLATEQRLPGIGNGVLQDILFYAKLNPKRKISTLKAEEKEKLYQTMKQILQEMLHKGGRDVERDLLGHPGKYHTILSSKTWKEPCPICGSTIRKEAYMGGTVYYCPTCQPLPGKQTKDTETLQ